MAPRRDLFPPDRGLQARMALAVLGCVALSAGFFALAVYLLSLLDGETRAGAILGLAAVLAVGLFAMGDRSYRSSGLEPTDEQRERAEAAVRRVAMMADVPAPRALLVVRELPLSWTVAPRRSAPVIWVTTGLLDRLDDDALEAAVAHEVSHIVRGNARFMTALAGPSAALVHGLLAIHGMTKPPVFLLACGLLWLPLAGSVAALARLVSRHREFTADRDAAELTGSPSAVAAALVAVSGALGERSRDLRATAADDAFHFVPVNDREHWLFATHPPVERRLEQLDRLERTLQGAAAERPLA